MAVAAALVMVSVVSSATPAAAATPVVTVGVEANPSTRPEPGGDFTYTVRVTNAGTEAVRITALNDSIYGNLTTRPGSTCGALIGPFLNPGAQVTCTFTASFTGAGSAGLANTVTASVITTAPSGETATASGSTTVTITDTLPAVQVTYTANPVAQPTPGGTFTFTVVVRNVGVVEAITITSLTDNVYGGLATRPGSTCGALIGTTLAPGATSAPCTFTGTFTGPAGARQTSVVTVTAVDDEGNPAVDDDPATIILSTIISITVDHSASPSSRPEPGGAFTFTEVITNTSAESLGIVALTDSVYGDLFTRPGSTCVSLDHLLLGPGASASCTFTGDVFGGAGLTQTSVVTVVAEDQEGRQATDNDDAAVAITGIPGGSRYVPLSPARIEDTRTGAGGLSGPLGPGATVAVQVGGRGGVPADASAVVMNVTVTQPTAEGFLTLYPDGSERPLAANVNFTPGKTVPNLVAVRLGPGGRVAMFNSNGSTHVVFDVAGYFVVGGGNAGRYLPQAPARIADTRYSAGGVRLGPGQSFDLQVSGQGGAPAAGVSAAVLNVAATGTTAESYLTIYPTGEPQPLAANLNFTAGDTVSNRAMVKLGAGGKVTIYNNAGETDVVVDIGGTFTDASVPAGPLGSYAPLAPARILDTRVGPPIPGGASIEVPVAGAGGVPAQGARAVILNVAVTQPAGPGYLTIFPASTAQPLASDLNYAAGETRSNLVVVQVGENGNVRLFTPAQAHVVVDVAGWFS